MLSNKLIFCHFLGLFTYGLTATVPQNLNRCKYGDSECIKNTINDILENKYMGYPELFLSSINPIHINAISISQGKESPVNIDLKFRDNELSAANGVRTHNVKGFGKDLKGPHEFDLKGDSITLSGPYETNGKVLVLPISGKGTSNITAVNPDIRISFMGEPVEKNGKTYMKIEKFKLTIDIDRMYMNFENLFNGDKALGDNMNLFLNENWKDIYHELRGSITKAFSMVFERIIQNVFDKFPYDELFIQE